jgi:hypothetical protein
MSSRIYFGVVSCDCGSIAKATKDTEMIIRSRIQKIIWSFVGEKRSGDAIDDVCNSEYTFTPKKKGNMSLETKYSSNIQKIMMLMLYNGILLCGFNTIELVNAR